MTLGANVIKLFNAAIYFHGNAIILCFKAILPWKLPWNGSKSLLYFNPLKIGLKLPQ
jgi:hypothetical protein